MKPLAGPLQIPDIAGWGAMDFVISVTLERVFTVGLSDCCEFLSLNLKGEKWLALNILGEQPAMKNLQS